MEFKRITVNAAQMGGHALSSRTANPRSYRRRMVADSSEAIGAGLIRLHQGEGKED